MIEEKRNYLKEFYDKKDNINYEEILRKTNNANENEINEIKKDELLKRLKNYRCPLQRIVDNLRQKS